MGSRKRRTLQDFPPTLPVALKGFVFFPHQGHFPYVTAGCGGLLTQTPNSLTNPKDPRGILKALQGSYGARVSSLACLRALFQLFLMYSGAQTAWPTWPRWNHSILSTLPMEPQRQIQPGKLQLWLFQAFLGSLLKPQEEPALILSAAILVLFLCQWYVVSCTDTMLNNWGCSCNRNKETQLLSVVKV